MKVKGMRKKWLGDRAKFMHKNGAKKYEIVAYLCTKGMTRSHAHKTVESL